MSFLKVFFEKQKRPSFFLYLLLALGVAWITQRNPALQVWASNFFRDTDDAVRLVQVRDLLTGQSWFDLKQHRMNPPDGTLMHWSRLIDAPLAGLITFFQLFTSAETAEKLTRLIWPAFLQLSLFSAVLITTRKLVGIPALLPVAVITGFQWVIGSQYEPGRIDHHSAQLLLAQMLVLSVLFSSERHFAIYCAGFISALMLAIGFEAVPIIAVCSLYFTSLWVLWGHEHFRNLSKFISSFAATHIALYVATTPQDLYETNFCDVSSPITLKLAVTSVLIVFMFHFFEKKLTTNILRLLALLCASILMGFIFLTSAKHCLSGPFTEITPPVYEFWLSRVGEAQGLLAYFQRKPWEAFAYCGLFITSLGCLVAAIKFDTARRAAWMLLLALCAVHIALCFNQIRSAPYAMLFALPAVGYCIVKLRDKSQPLLAIIFLGALAPFWAFVNVSFSTHKEPEKIEDALSCHDEKSFTALKTLPAGAVLAPIDLGAQILVHTSHHIFAAPYHRNNSGILFLMTVLNGSKNEAHTLLKNKNVNYIASCGENSDFEYVAKKQQNSFAKALLANESIDGIEPLNAAPPLKIWRVK